MADDRYDRVTFHGKVVDKYTRAALEACEKDLGYELTIVQGSYHGGVSASAGTHDGGGAVDLAPYDHVRKVKALRTHGFAAWYRYPIKGLWGAHIHAIQIGNTKASPAAKRQIVDYRNGRNGLANHARDTEWRPKSISPFKYPRSAATLAKEDDMPTQVKKLHRTGQKLRAGKWDYVTLNKKGDVTILFGNDAVAFTGKIAFHVEGLKDGERVYVQAVRSTKKGTITTSVASLGTDNFTGAYFEYPATGTLAASHNSRLRLRVKAPHKGVTIKYVWPQLLTWK